MNIQKAIRAWKDRTYRESLSQEELAELPATPIGEALDEHALSRVVGGIGTISVPGCSKAGCPPATDTCGPRGGTYSVCCIITP